MTAPSASFLAARRYTSYLTEWHKGSTEECAVALGDWEVQAVQVHQGVVAPDEAGVVHIRAAG
jgi:hypothetical protein